jgi:lysozyme
MMRISQNGQSLIKSFEGCHTIRKDGMVEAYIDPVGVWTIGWGHTATARPGLVISQAKADALFLDDLDTFERAVNKLVKVPLTQNQFDALVSFTYNLGAGALERSTLLKRLNAGDYDAVPDQLMRWNKGRVNGKLTVLRGLTRRRAAEAALFVAHEAPVSVGAVEADQPKPKVKSRKFWGTITAGVGSVLGWLTNQVDALAEGVSSASETLLQYIPYVPELSTVLTVLVVAGVVLAIYAQFDDAKKSKA